MAQQRAANQLNGYQVNTTRLAAGTYLLQLKDKSNKIISD